MKFQRDPRSELPVTVRNVPDRVRYNAPPRPDYGRSGRFLFWCLLMLYVVVWAVLIVTAAHV